MKTAVIELLRRDAAEVAERFASELHTTNPLYRDVGDPKLHHRSRDAAFGSIIAFAAWLERGTGELAPDESAYLHDQAVDSAAQLFPVEALEEPVQMGVELLWGWIVEACEEAGHDPAETVAVLKELTRFQIAVQRVLTDAYVEARFQPDADGREVQHELVDTLLAGRSLRREVRARLLTEFGLGGADESVVLVATADPAAVDTDDKDAVSRATDIARQRPASRRWLVADRGHEVVGVLALRGGVRAVIDEVSQWTHQLRRIHGIDLGAGISTPGALSDVPDRYVEAHEALRLSKGRDDRLAALPRVRLFEYLTNRTDPTVRRLVPAAVRQLRLQDARSGGVLSETLMAMAECDLNVRRAAAMLYVHRNTVHYRLRRIAALTGYDPRRFFDLVDLVAALRSPDAAVEG